MRKEKIFIITAIVFCLLISCASSRPGTGVSSDILEHQRKIAELENTIRNYEAAIDDTVRALTELRDRAEDMGETVDGVIELFGQYQRLVEQLIRNCNSLRIEIEKAKQDAEYTTVSYCCPYDINGSWLRPLPERYKGTEMVRYIAITAVIEDGKRELEKKYN